MRIGNIEVYGIIYKITNKINGKIYIGQTTRGFNKRYPYSGSGIERVYNYYTHQKEKDRFINKHLVSSIEKYGFYAFEVIEVYDLAFSKEELNIKEKHYIKVFNCIDNGYNFGDGGEINAMQGSRWTEEQTEKMREYMSGENNPMYDIHRYGEDAPMYGKHHTDDTKKKISKTRIEKGIGKGENCYFYGKHFNGKNNSNAKSVICLTTKRIFHTIKEGASYYNCKPSNITCCCRGSYKSAGKLDDGTKLIWRYLKWKHNKIYRIKWGV